MNNIIQEIIRNRPVVTDGAWGTQLQERGLPPGACPDAWNIDRPESVMSVAQAYVDAGSSIILTNTFGANGILLEKHGLKDKTREINRTGAALSRKAAGDTVRVFGSIGPSGKMLLMGEITEEQLRKAFEEQAAGLAEGGVDAIIIETMSDLTEATIAYKAAKKTDLPVIVSMVFDSGKEKDRTIMGITVEDAVTALEKAGADAVGANCGPGIESYIPVVRRLRTATRLPIWIKPNAGLPEIVEGSVRYSITPDTFAEHAGTLIREGADFIGGCCGTNPDFIRALVSLKHTV
jgi:5-methyltetrahydrofolate--homocysteine methyltransferase